MFSPIFHHFPPLFPAFSAKAHHGAVLHQGQVQPAAAPAAPRGGAVLVAHLLQHFAHAHLRQGPVDLVGRFPGKKIDPKNGEEGIFKLDRYRYYIYIYLP